MTSPMELLAAEIDRTTIAVSITSLAFPITSEVLTHRHDRRPRFRGRVLANPSVPPIDSKGGEVAKRVGFFG